RIHRHYCHLELGEMPREPRQQLIGQTRLAGPARAGNTDDRHLLPRAPERAADLLHPFAAAALVAGALKHTDGADADALITGAEGPELVRRLARCADARKHIVDHPGESETAAVLRCVDLLHPVALERLDLVRCDRAATPDHHAHVLVAALTQHVDHVGEVLVVAALVGADGDGVGVLVDGAAPDVSHPPAL